MEAVHLEEDGGDDKAERESATAPEGRETSARGITAEKQIGQFRAS